MLSDAERVRLSCVHKAVLTKWCSGCERQLPRQSFTDCQWGHKSYAKRKCVKCRRERSALGMWKCVQCLEAKSKEDAFKLWKSRSGSMTKRMNTRCDVCVRQNDQAQLVAWGLVEESEE